MDDRPDGPEPVTVEATTDNVVFDDDEEEDEDECRVCRGPAEEGRPLYSPCKCSGSMGMTHQDCLTSWLEVTRGSGRCEICKVKFRFDPQYAANAPDRLPAYEVLLGLSSRFMARWLPLTCRFLVAISLWLIVAPFLTNLLYHGWMIRPSSILNRWKWELFFPDVVSGAVTAAMIIVSFLSLMSFADFLRVHLQQGPRDQPARQRQDGLQQVRNYDDGGILIELETEIQDHAVDKGVIEFLETRRQSMQLDRPLKAIPEENVGNVVELLEDRRQSEGLDPISESLAVEDNGGGALVANLTPPIDTLQSNRADATLQNRLMGETGARGGGENEIPEIPDGDDVDSEDDDSLEDMLDDSDDESIEDEHQENNNNGFLDGENFNALNEDLNRMVENAPDLDAMDPALQDDQADMEINVALDEMLGLRGPFSALIRNMLWLLAFNATYLGIFGFVPKTVGSVAYSGIFNTTFCLNVVKAVPFVYSEDQNQTTVMSVLSRLEEESNERSTTFKLSDVATVILGYLSIASLIVLTRYATVIFQKMGQKFGRNSLRRTINQEARHFHRANAGHAAIDPDGIDAVDGEAGMNSVAGGLDTMVSIVKVGVLLFLKMFLLPLFLGFCLDASTVRLFGHDLDRRLAFAGSDLFSFILLHWVSGITFMLLVTVFLLQLREVAHPDVLARVIRPQEPQPDLLGNLLHETVTTHMKRMFLSLVIYAPLLMLQISLPIRLFLESGLAEKVTFFQLNFYHVLMPQLQIPLELITFHLSMLALLERYKNSIGGMQHKWLKFICNITGLTEYLLPKEIAGFERIGSKSVFLPKEAGDLEVDSFFLKMAKVKSSTAGEELIVSTFSGSQSQSRMIVQGETRENGERVLVADTMHIALPFAGRSDSDSSDASMEQTAFLPTKIGRYRLRLQDENEVMQPTIEIFREVLGDVIKRPPDGWDDLGVGGAWVQGRWAWSTERKSVIEAGVAQRIPFRVLPNRRWSVSLLAKIGLLLFSSWLAITLAAVAMLSAPLAVGRSFYYLLRIPTKFIHDPFAFCIGAALFFPAASMIIRNVRETDESHLKRLGHWLSKFKLPPVKKFCVLAEAFLLWFLVAPIILGVSYEITFVKPSEWFSQGGSLLELKTLVFSWLMGTVVLNTWSFLLYFKCFTKRFWANIGNGILEPPMDENGNFIPLARNQDPRDEVNGNENAWQGNGGRAAAFFITWRTVLRNWEWDAVDRVPLLEEFARPVTRQIASAFVGSSLSFQILLYIVATACPTQGNDFVLPLVGPVFQGTFCMMVYRLCSLSHLLLQLSSSFRDSIDVWFEAAHEAARDGRYLIGERLLNYEEDLDSTRIAS